MTRHGGMAKLARKREFGSARAGTKNSQLSARQVAPLLLR